MKNESSLDEVYLDLNMAAQALVRMAQKLGYNIDVKDDPKWPILRIDLPTGQVS